MPPVPFAPRLDKAGQRQLCEVAPGRLLGDFFILGQNFRIGGGANMLAICSVEQRRDNALGMVLPRPKMFEFNPQPFALLDAALKGLSLSEMGSQHETDPRTRIP